MHRNLSAKNMKKSMRVILSAFGRPGEKEEERKVQDLIEDARACLAQETANTRKWESLELNQASILLNAGFPRLAIISVGKAIAIHNLSPEEYAFGFTIVQKQTHAISDIKIFHSIAQGVAEDLKASESIAADHLKEAQEGTAIKLLKRQARAASELEQENKDNAHELFLTQESAMEALRDGEEKIISHMHDLEKTLSWMAGGYSNQTASSDSVIDGIFHSIQNAQKETAHTLKQHQESIASELRKHQVHIASNLKAAEKVEAESLKVEQKEQAAHLKDRQEAKAIEVAHVDKKDTAS